MERERFSKEEWKILTKKLRNRASAYFDPKELETIDRFIQLAGQGAIFDQVSQ
ncbi:MAG TPA: hypothetical protein VFC10_02700 [Terriglobia bacterium]|jgi:hypothetical protein|nr:hypothetical protein [Terriglobia bacterium]